MPWHIATERGIFAKHGVDVEFIEEACGTGAMIAKVRRFWLHLVDFCLLMAELSAARK